MLGEDIKIFTAQLLDIYDANDRDVIGGLKLSSDDLLDLIDQRYREDAFSALKTKQPSLFRRRVFLNNWEWTGTVNASSSGTTLVVGSDVFDSDMIGAKVYNSTKSVSAEITAYISTTSVTLNTSIGNDWDGDTIYVLTGRYPFKEGTALENAIEAQYVGVLYSTADTKHRATTRSSFDNVYENYYEDDSQYSDIRPISFDASLRLQDTYEYPGIQIRPIPSINITRGICMEVTQLPSRLELASEPMFPKGHHVFLAYGAAADAGVVLEKDQAFIDRMENKYQKGLQKLLTEYRPSPKVRRRFYRNAFR
jgi:hypothetical protein